MILSALNKTPMLAQESIRSWWFPEQASTVAGTNDALFMFIFWVSVFFFVLVMGLVAYFTVKYRRKPGVAQERSPAHHTPLEVTWTVGPCFLLLIMFVWGFKGFIDMQVNPAKGEEILVTAAQWNWSATYDNGAGQGADFVRLADYDAPVIRVPAGKPINLLMTSTDVIHSFFVPDFRVKMDIFPNRYSTAWFESTSELEEHYDDNGELLGKWTDHILYCTEYCGNQHSQMLAVIRVMPESDFIQWKATAANIFKDDLRPSEVGANLYRAKGCNACHTVDGTPGTGPTWQGMYGTERTFTNASPVVADANYIRESIYEPAAKLRTNYPNQMQSYQGLINDKELFALISYMKTLSSEGQAELTDEKTYGEMEAETEG